MLARRPSRAVTRPEPAQGRPQTLSGAVTAASPWRAYVGPDRVLGFGRVALAARPKPSTRSVPKSARHGEAAVTAPDNGWGRSCAG